MLPPCQRRPDPSNGGLAPQPGSAEVILAAPELYDVPAPVVKIHSKLEFLAPVARGRIVTRGMRSIDIP
jgi:hypothetical protein